MYNQYITIARYAKQTKVPTAKDIGSTGQDSADMHHQRETSPRKGQGHTHEIPVPRRAHTQTLIRAA